MQVTSKIKMDLTKPELSPYVNAVQGDSYSRSLEIALYTGVHPWNIPDDTSVAVRYAKPDRTGGYYDTLPDGTSAWHISGNTLTIQLAPQMLTVAGNVKVQIELIQGTRFLSTFCLTVRVEANAAAGVVKSENYINWLQWIQEQSAAQVTQIELSVQAAEKNAQATDRSSQIAAQAEENAIAASSDSAASAANADISAKQAAEALASMTGIREETKSIAAEVSAIVAGNEAYTKEESNSLFGSIIHSVAVGDTIALTDSLDQSVQILSIYGKTTQNGTPSPERPVALVNTGHNGSIIITAESPDSDSDAQSHTLYIPYALSGIPVSSGGNYVDEQGQQWICDELDFERGVYVQRIEKTDFSQLTFTVSPDSNGYPAGESLFFQAYLKSPLSNWVTQYRSGLCTKLPFNRSALNQDINGFYCLGARVYCRIQGVSDQNTFNTCMAGAEFLIPLEPPIEIPLSAEAWALSSTVHTVYPSTTILNDSEAGMKICYCADTKHYIDNKIAALAALTA